MIDRAEIRADRKTPGVFYYISVLTQTAGSTWLVRGVGRSNTLTVGIVVGIEQNNNNNTGLCYGVISLGSYILPKIILSS